MENTTTVNLELNALDGGLVRADVKVADGPRDLFGAAFDLVITGGDWSLEKYEAGDFFSLAGSPPLMMAVEKGGTGDAGAVKGASGLSGSHRIITGLSLKRGSSLESGDGTLVSFYIRPVSAGADLKFSFANNVLSALREGKRVDLKTAVWNGVEMTSAKTFGAEKSLQADENALSEDGTQGLLSGSSVQADLLRGFGDDSREILWWGSPLAQVYIFLGIVFAIMLVVIFVLVAAKKFKFN